MKYIHIYKQVFNPIIRRLLITNEDMINGFIKTKCNDCNGTGLFKIPNGEYGVMYSRSNPVPYKLEKCITCKGIGKVDVTL